MPAEKTLFSNLQILQGKSLQKGWALFQAGELLEFGFGTKPSADHNSDSSLKYLTPRLIETHVHGGGGHSVEGGVEQMRSVLDFHSRAGVGRSLLSTVSAPIDQLLKIIDQAAELYGSDDRFLGLHLEGPFLASSHSGAHDPNTLHAPSDAELEQLIRASNGIVKSITLAPELITAKQMNMILAANIQPCAGHTACDFKTAEEFFKAGSRVLTHAFNGMPGIHHREPGPVMAALENAAVYSELIADGIHVAAAVAKTLDPKRVILVTDAMSATGLGDGQYSLGSLAVTVQNAVARTSSGSLAGSTLTLAKAVQNFAGWIGSEELAFSAAIHNPISAYSLPSELGEITRENHLLWSDQLEIIS